MVDIIPDNSEVMIGATVDGSSETGLGELASEADVKTYLDSYTSSWTEPDESFCQVQLYRLIKQQQPHISGLKR